MNVSDKYPFPQGKPDHPSFSLLYDWWQQLNDNRGERAVLRRAAGLTEVMLSPAYVRLLRTLRNQGYAIGNSDPQLARIAAIAGLAAQIKEPASNNLAKRMGTPKPGGANSAVSELRLRRILACDDIEELYTLLHRALALLGDQANLANLAAIIWHWVPLDEKCPYDPRRQLAYDYYAVAPVKP